LVVPTSKKRLRLITFQRTAATFQSATTEMQPVDEEAALRRKLAINWWLLRFPDPGVNLRFSQVPLSSTWAKVPIIVFNALYALYYAACFVMAQVSELPVFTATTGGHGGWLALAMASVHAATFVFACLVRRTLIRDRSTLPGAPKRPSQFRPAGWPHRSQAVFYIALLGTPIVLRVAAMVLTAATLRTGRGVLLNLDYTQVFNWEITSFSLSILYVYGVMLGLAHAPGFVILPLSVLSVLGVISLPVISGVYLTLPFNLLSALVAIVVDYVLAIMPMQWFRCE
jgi:hypothetical protein